jgi:AraC-like DNA-binding protein
MEKIPIRQISTSQREPDASERFTIRDLQRLLDGKDMVQELHRHDFYYVLILEKGAGTHEIDFIPYTIGDRSVFFMRPGQVHQLLLKSDSKGYLMQFRDEFYLSPDKGSGQLLRKASHINHYQLDVKSCQKLLSILKYIYDEDANKDDKYTEIIKANMGMLFIELLRQYKTASPTNANLYTQERLEEFLELLDKHAFEHKQVLDYASMLHLSAYQLNAITKATLGKTCSELINDHIILEAKRYLLATSNQINQIADELGYEDVSYFTRFFRKHTGYSPEAFRQNSR